MGWKLVDFDALGAKELDAWLRTRAADPALDSPFFHPAFAAAVHTVFGDVQVATEDQEHQVWFPLQVSRGLARPVGVPGADFQGPVAAPGVRIDPLKLVRETGIRVLQFDHLSDKRPEFGPWSRLASSRRLSIPPTGSTVTCRESARRAGTRCRRYGGGAKRPFTS